MLSKTDKNKIVKGTLVGGLLGACIGAPGLGMLAGGFVNYNNKNKRRPYKCIIQKKL